MQVCQTFLLVFTGAYSSMSSELSSPNKSFGSALPPIKLIDDMFASVLSTALKSALTSIDSTLIYGAFLLEWWLLQNLQRL